MHIYKIKQKAVNLRKEGYSYTYISRSTNIAKSTLSGWLRNIPFKPNKYTINTIGKARVASGAKKHLIKIDSLKKAKIQAKKDIKNLSKRDLFMLGLGVYIGEGTKSYDITRIINANPKIIKLSVRWLKEICKLKTTNLRLRLHLYPDNNEKKSINFWSKETKIPINQFYKSVIDTRANKKMGKRDGK